MLIMKKTWIIIAVVLMVFACAACGKQGVMSGFTDNGDGTSTALDTENSPLDGGLLITLDKNEGTVNMQITNASGAETVEYLKFYPAEETCERYKYVSMMGTGFYYTYDYGAGELTKIMNMDGDDSTQSSKDSGRFEGAQSETQEYVDKLIAYFNETYGMTLAEAVE